MEWDEEKVALISLSKPSSKAEEARETNEEAQMIFRATQKGLKWLPFRAEFLYKKAKCAKSPVRLRAAQQNFPIFTFIGGPIFRLSTFPILRDPGEIGIPGDGNKREPEMD